MVIQGAHVWGDLGYFICVRHLFRSTAVINRKKRNAYFLLPFNTLKTASETRDLINPFSKFGVEKGTRVKSMKMS